MRRDLYTSDQSADRLDFRRGTPFGHLPRDGRAGGGFDEVGRPDLDGGGAGHEKLHGVFGAHDAPDADDRDTHLACDSIDRRDCHGLDRGTGQTTRDGPQHGTARPDVDRHALKGVDGRNRVSAGFLHAPGDLRDIRNVRGQLGDERKIRETAQRGNKFGRATGIGTEVHARPRHWGTTC